MSIAGELELRLAAAIESNCILLSLESMCKYILRNWEELNLTIKAQCGQSNSEEPGESARQR